MPERRYVWVEDRRGNRLPFSKGILATSVTATGVTPEDAYRVAEGAEDELFQTNRAELGVDELVQLVERVIGRQLGEREAATWSGWVEARRTGGPIVVLIGGSSGVGKSTVATRLAARLGITQVVATDAIREVMGSMFPDVILPTLHVPSFQAHEQLRVSVPDEHDPVVLAFRQQADTVVIGIRKLVERALEQQTDLILEGAHLVPGMLAEELAEWRTEATVSQTVLAVQDPGEHRTHFLAQVEYIQSERPARYLEHFQEIRAIHRYLVRQAQVYGVPVVEVGALDQAVQSVLEAVIEEVAQDRTESAAP